MSFILNICYNVLMKKLWSKESSPFIVMIVLAVLAVGALAYYFAVQPIIKSMNNHVDVKAEMQKCQTKNDKDVCQFITNWKVNKNYRATVAGPGTTKSFIEIEGDKKHIVVNSDTGITETIIDGNTAYYKANGAWYRKTDACGGTDCSMLDPLGLNSDKLTFKKRGKEPCSAGTCFKYEVSVKTGGTQFTGLLWFDDKDYKLRHTVSQNGNMTVEATYEYGNIHITVPAKFQDAPATPPAPSATPTPTPVGPGQSTPQPVPAPTY